MDFLRSILESDQAKVLARASGSALGEFLAGLLGPLLSGLL